MARSFALALAMSLAALPSLADAPPFAANARVGDAELASMRGGFAVAGGIDVAAAVQMDAGVDGSLVLRTVFRVDQLGATSLAVYAPLPGQTGPAFTATQTGTTSASAPVVIAADRAGGLTTLQPGSTTPALVASSTVGNPAVGLAPAGLAPLSVPGGGLQTAAGHLTVSAVPLGTQIALNGQMFSVTQLVGQAFRNVLTNSGNNRAIDTATTINVDLRNTSATQAAAGAARIQGITSDLALRLAR